MITVAALLLVSMQPSGEAPVAIAPEQPKTWSVEYPFLISPYVDEYRGCLNGGIRTIGDDIDFEKQHRSDIPRCTDVADKASREAKAVLEKRGRDSGTDVDAVFATIRLIHVERGRDLDEHIRIRLAANPIYRQDVSGDADPRNNVAAP